MPKITVRDPPGTNGWTLAHCLPSSEWGPGGNTREIKAARKGTGSFYIKCLRYGDPFGLSFTERFLLQLKSENLSNVIITCVHIKEQYFTVLTKKILNIIKHRKILI